MSQTHDGEFREQDKHEGGKVEREEDVVVLCIMGGDQESTVSRSNLAYTHNPIGTLVSHFFAGVYCAPESICSQSVNSSYAPPAVILGVNHYTFLHHLRRLERHACDMMKHEERRLWSAA